ncbi:MAG: glycosyltransferase [Chloroflexota bacterium]
MAASPLPLAIVIPARNEAAVIGGTIECLRRHMESGDVIVVIDDGSNDGTGEIAERGGAKVVRRSDPLPCSRSERGRTGVGAGKSSALKFLLQSASTELDHYAAVVILDADTKVDAGFLACIRSRFAAGAQAVQGFIVPVGDRRSAFGALSACSALLEQKIDDRLRAALGWPVRLRGTGMAFRPDVFRAAAPQLRTHVEDVELSIVLALRGVRVVFAPEAIIFDPAPENTALAANQRARWLRGQWDVWRLYWREILALSLRGPWAWSLLGSLLFKPKSLIAAANMFLLGISLAFPQLRVFSALLALSLFADAAYFLLGLALVEMPGRRLRRLFSAPAYLALWLRSVAVALRSSQVWLRAR